jgi:acyl-CoA thioester hydrolase
MTVRHVLPIRVRYQETDGQGRVHHANYLNYFEQGRVELLRSLGHSYRELEEQGIMLVVAEISCRYLAPALFDDLLQLETEVVLARGARIEHRYRLTRGGQLLVEGHSVVACIDRQGRVCRLPEFLRAR